ncbi:MAG TPA: multicopper oxidase domain-containing protein, partial [Longimicrobiales bacterium]
HGQTVVANHMRTDVLSLLPMEMVIANMAPDNPGKWLFHCHFFDHSDGGMQALFTVKPKVAVLAAPR